MSADGTKRPRLSSSEHYEKNNFARLPREVRVHIAQFLSDVDLVRLSQTCTLWRRTLLDEDIWSHKCRQHRLTPSPEISASCPETRWRDTFLEKLQVHRNWQCPEQVPIVKMSEKPSGHRSRVVGISCDRVLALNAGRKLLAWNSLTGDFCWERSVDSEIFYLGKIIVNVDFPNGLGVVISPENGETVQKWDMGVITDVAVHEARVVSVSDEGGAAGCLRFWSPESRSFIVSVGIAGHRIDHLAFDGKLVIIAYTEGDIEVWNTSCFCLDHRYPNQAKISSLVFDEMKIYISFIDDDFVQVWSLGENHHKQLVEFEKSSTLQLSGELLIGLAPSNSVKVWDKSTMMCHYRLNLDLPIVRLQSPHLIAHSGDKSLKIYNLLKHSCRSHEIDLNLPDEYRVHEISTSDSKLVADARRNDGSLLPLLVFDFTKPRTLFLGSMG